MYLDAFHAIQNNLIQITPEQGSRFAKEISDDFNPLHNPESKRFCVPGDLLFALTLARLGLSKKMVFNYTGMVGKDAELSIPDTNEKSFTIKGGNDKPYLNVSREGQITKDMTLIEAFSKAYVAFSGRSFPHILVPLMQEHNVMINPLRPMVIYESMAFEFDDFNVTHPSLELDNSQLKVDGKRGVVRLEFAIMDNGTQIGKGYKTMVMSGLREYEQEQVDSLIELYESSKASYTA